MASPGALEGVTPYLLYLLCIATVGTFLFGYHLSELNAPQDVITCVRETITASRLDRVKSALGLSSKTRPAGADAGATATTLPQCIPMDAAQFGLVSSIFTLGGLVGALAAGPITAKHGRLKTMLFSGVFAIIGPALEAAAPNITAMAIGRFVSGLGAGAATVVVPIYISEIAPPGKKGFFGSFTQITINCGILLTQLLGLFLSKGQLWRIILGVGGVIALAQAVGLVLAGQESPRWLAGNGRPTTARKILLKIRGKDANVDAEVAGWGAGGTPVGRDLEDEEETLLASGEHARQASAESEDPDAAAPSPASSSSSSAVRAARGTAGGKSQTIGTFAVLRHPDHAFAVFAIAMIMVAQQLTGINSIVMYGVSLLADLMAANSAALNVAVAALNIVVTTSCAPLVDRLGRKRCLLLSITGMGLSSILLAVGIMRAVSILSAVAVILFVASFGLGLGPVPFILASELVTPDAVGAAQSWALAANWISTFLVAQFFPMVNQRLGKGQVYFIFAAFALVFGLFIAWKVPETKGKRDADEVWGRTKAQHRQD